VISYFSKNKPTYFVFILLIILIHSTAFTDVDKNDKSQKDAVFYYNLGVSYLTSHEYLVRKEAIEAFEQAIRIKPDHADAHCFLGMVYVAIKNKGSALEEYKILKILDKEKANELFNIIYP